MQNPNSSTKNQVLATSSVILLTLIIFIFLASCGRSNGPLEYGTSIQAEGAGPRPGGSLPGTDEDYETDMILDVPYLDYSDNQFHGQTLTISVLGDWFIAPHVAAYMRENPGIMINVTDFGADWERAREYTNIHLMAGIAPDLIDANFLDFNNPRITPYLADWFPIMNACLNFNEDDFFMNVFHAAAVNGQLYAFPLIFSFEMITANSTIPGITEALMWYDDGITASQLINLKRVSDSITGKYMAPDSNAGTWMRYYFHNFFDFGSRRVDFNNQRFIDFINHAREVTNPESDFYQGSFNALVQPSQELQMSERYFFQSIGQEPRLQYFVEFDEDFLFTNPTPIVSDHGELIIHPWITFVLNAETTTENQALAWDFMHFMSGATRVATNTHPDWLPLMPLNRSALRYSIEMRIPILLSRISVWFLGRQPYGTESEAIESVIDMITALGDMPMIATTTVPHSVSVIMGEEISNFHHGIITAEEAAENLQKRITETMAALG